RALHEARDRFLERRDAVVGVAAVLGAVDLGLHHAADALGRHRVVLADPEVDERPLGMVRQRLALRALDLLELVDVRALAVRRAADALGEEALEVGIAHDRESYDAPNGEATTRAGVDAASGGSYRDGDDRRRVRGRRALRSPRGERGRASGVPR